MRPTITAAARMPPQNVAGPNETSSSLGTRVAAM